MLCFFSSTYLLSVLLLVFIWSMFILVSYLLFILVQQWWRQAGLRPPTFMSSNNWGAKSPVREHLIFEACWCVRRRMAALPLWIKKKNLISIYHDTISLAILARISSAGLIKSPFIRFHVLSSCLLSSSSISLLILREYSFMFHLTNISSYLILIIMWSES